MSKENYEIIREIAVLSTSEKGWRKELNIISWDGREPEYDIRDWSQNRSMKGVGVTLDVREAKALFNAFDSISTALNTELIHAENMNNDFFGQEFDLNDEKNIKKAQKLLDDDDKMEKFLQKLEKKLRTVPIAGNALSYVPVMISLVRMYMKKEYREIPVASIISIVVALGYVLSPVDLIPDFIPGVGYMDDGAIVLGCIALVKTDIDDYILWRRRNGYEVENLPDYEKIKENAEQDRKIMDAYLKGKKKSR